MRKMQPKRDGPRAQHMSRRGKYRDPALVDVLRSREVYDHRPDRKVVGRTQVPVQFGGDCTVDRAVDKQEQFVANQR
jgi:hypothetical protein